MEEIQPSTIAIAGAMMRAAHLLLDDEPKILRDDLALGLSGLKDNKALREVIDGMISKVAQRTTTEFAQSFLRSLRAEVAWRNRYAEDELEKALQCGVTQYVILGAGLDSFAYRSRDVAKAMQIFEIDLPAIQRWKQEQLHVLGVEIPSNVTFVPLDFEQQTLWDVLQASGYHIVNPGFFSWLAVTSYLTEDAIFSTLIDIVSLATGTEIVFEYTVPDSLVNEEGQRLVATAKAMATEGGELPHSYFDPASLRASVQALGFTVIEDIGPEEAYVRYFEGRRDELHPFPSFHIMKARVSSYAKPDKTKGNCHSS
ncbi:class I SAM-dependent methyltransferase [Chloroflexota bacterium]